MAHNLRDQCVEKLIRPPLLHILLLMHVFHPLPFGSSLKATTSHLYIMFILYIGLMHVIVTSITLKKPLHEDETF